MSKIILQPAGSSDAGAHFNDTITNPVDINRIARFVGVEITEKLRALHKDLTVPVWGVTPGKDGVNINKWNRVQTGDIVLFSKNKKIFASATVAFTIHNKELALELWGTNSDEETWEYIYFLDEIQPQDISYESFNRVAGYKENNIIQGFGVLDEEKSQNIIEHFDLESETYYPPVSPQEYFDAITFDPTKPLEKQALVKTRKEQAFLRNSLFKGKKYSNCAICGKEYPVAFLVTAHIKKRTNCTDEEKRDYRNIVMPMCRFGCDELYENGYISVKKGKVVSLAKEDVTDVLTEYIHGIESRDIGGYWNSGTQKYFEWHLNRYTPIVN